MSGSSDVPDGGSDTAGGAGPHARAGAATPAAVDEARGAPDGAPPARKGRSSSGRETAAAFGARVAMYREQQGLSQEALAARAHLSQAGLSHVEAGTRTPSIETARLLAEALGVSVGALMGEPAPAVTSAEAQFLRVWRAASRSVRQQVADYLGYLTSRDPR